MHDLEVTLQFKELTSLFNANSSHVTLIQHLPPAPTVMSSHVCINCEPIWRVLGEEKSDEDGDGDEAEKMGKGTDGDDLGEEGDEGEGEDEDEDEGGDVDEDEGVDVDEDEDMDEEKNSPLVRFGQGKATLASSVEGKIFIFVAINFFFF